MTQNEISLLAAKLSSFRPFACSCKQCRGLCANVSCAGTPQDIKALIDAGHKDDLIPTVHWGSLEFGLPPLECVMIRHGAEGIGCSLFVGGKCSLHDKGLKPSEGKFANHNPHEQSFPHICATWLIEENRELVAWIFAQFPPLEPIDAEEVWFMTEIAEKVRKLTKEGYDPRQVHQGAMDAVANWQRNRMALEMLSELFGGSVTVGIVEREEISVK